MTRTHIAGLALVAVFLFVLLFIIETNWSRDRDANILIFCTKEYDAGVRAGGTENYSYYKDPTYCLNAMKRDISNGE